MVSLPHDGRKVNWECLLYFPALFTLQLFRLVFTGGIWEGLISTLISMAGYFLLDMSLSELVGIVPFAGGSFGFVRCSLGPFLGFMAASAEMCMYMFYTIRTVQKMAQMVTFVTLLDKELEPVWALIAYCLVLVFHLRGGGWFWNTMLGCTIFTILLLAVFLVSSWTITDFDQYAHSSHGFDGNGSTFLENLYYSMWFYQGM